MTKTEKIIQYLIDNGSIEVSCRSRKYKKFQHLSRIDHYYWIGKKGAVRAGETLADSISITDYIQKWWGIK